MNTLVGINWVWKQEKKPLKLYVDLKPYTLIVMWNLNQSSAIKISQLFVEKNHEVLSKTKDTKCANIKYTMPTS
jgi:hypothetical protein